MSPDTVCNCKNDYSCFPASWSDQSLHNLGKAILSPLPPDTTTDKVREEVVEKARVLGVVGQPVPVSDLEQLLQRMGYANLKEKIIQHLKASPNMVGRHILKLAYELKTEKIMFIHLVMI